MKRLLALLFLSVFLGSALNVHANENDLKEIILEQEDYSLEAFTETSITKENNQRRVDLYNLQKAKFKMISGDLKLASFFLNRISDRESVVVAIKKRYLAMIHFIEGRFDKSIAELNDKRVNDNNYFTQTCLLRMINFMALNDTVSINREKKACAFYTGKYSRNDQFWLDSMIKLKTSDKVGLKKNLLTDVEYTISDDEMSKLWLKTGLYLNKEAELLELIALLPESSYESKKLREIIAFMYLRRGDAKKALAFVDDIDSANAENIKGNINLSNKEYELAFGHFRLALQKKQDSSNALERAIPLAFILNQWEDGLSMLNNISTRNLDPRNKAAVRIAFLIREKQFLVAQKELTLLKIAFQFEPPFEVNIMDTYVNLVLGDKEKGFDRRKVEDSAEKACKAFDGISCWIAMQYIQWENLGKTIKRDEPIFADKEMTVASLKEKQALNPLVESISIDQSDIEELDGETIKISPK
jgi:hypothetical protein